MSKTIDDYIATFPEDTQKILQKVRATIAKVVPEATEGISYGIPTFYVNGAYLVYFAGWKHHISVYPLPAGGDAAYQKQIAPHVEGAGTAKFALDQPIPYDLIEKTAQLLREEAK